eukprot:TRINITY_DN83161_c0_g1_i1.p1 TRINITY_DN83161_c0_g1~~TRINITY_DN83161_c0_g1_i1.p1  ORF type:complete len:307 (+),score=43.16 TRINITY_DN83161_c0_g1_i1:24-944(+)
MQEDRSADKDEPWDIICVDAPLHRSTWIYATPATQHAPSAAEVSSPSRFNDGMTQQSPDGPCPQEDHKKSELLRWKRIARTYLETKHRFGTMFHEHWRVIAPNKVAATSAVSALVQSLRRAQIMHRLLLGSFWLVESDRAFSVQTIQRRLRASTVDSAKQVVLAVLRELRMDGRHCEVLQVSRWPSQRKFEISYRAIQKRRRNVCTASSSKDQQTGKKVQNPLRPQNRFSFCQGLPYQQNAVRQSNVGAPNNAHVNIVDATMDKTNSIGNNTDRSIKRNASIDVNFPTLLQSRYGQSDKFGAKQPV